jgi:hypothetical protein
MLVDLLTMYINDKNSSTIREFITVTLAGYKHQRSKIGYNGFKQDAFVPGKTIKCEAKTKNIHTGTKSSKLNGGGNFTDYTPARLKRDKKENLNILVSGFIDGKLIYIMEFPFNCPSFMKCLEKQIKKWQEKLKGSKTTKGQFLRSASFTYKDYIKCPKLKVVFLLPKKELSEYKDYIVKDFYKFLIEKAK